MSPKEVGAFRLRRHHLVDRAPWVDLATVAGDIGGAQAQMLSAAELSLWARVRGLRAQDVATALWVDRTLARAWCMRRTLFLLPSADLAIFVRGSARRAERELKWMRRHGVPERQLVALVDATLRALDAPATREELARDVSRRLGLRTRRSPGGGWGSTRDVPGVDLGPFVCPAGYLLHLVGASGVVCSGPPRGSEPTFVRADAWLGEAFEDRFQARAEEELLRRYLRAFGPASLLDFVAWTRHTLTDARRIWDRLASELVPVGVDGATGWLLREDLPALAAARPDGPNVRLLPHFDTFLLGHFGRDHLVGPAHRARVYRDQGWIAPVVLVDGAARGVWRHARVDGGRLRVDVEPFGRFSRKESAGLRSEAEALAGYLGGTGLDLRIAPPRGPPRGPVRAPGRHKRR